MNWKLGGLIAWIIALILHYHNAHAETTYTQIKPVLQIHCSSCHNENWAAKNWMDYETAKRNAPLIRIKVWQEKTMPPGNFTGMTDGERKQIKNWVDDGAKK